MVGNIYADLLSVIFSMEIQYANLLYCIFMNIEQHYNVRCGFFEYLTLKLSFV